MLKRLSIFALALLGCGVSVIQADATLTYELTEADGKKTVKQFAVSRFFVRIDDPTEPERYLLFQAGKFFPLYSVDQEQGTYTRLTPPVSPRLGPVSRSKQAAKVGKANKETLAIGAKTDQAAGQKQGSQWQAGAADSAEIESDKPSPQPAAFGDSGEIEPDATSAEPAAQPGPNIAAPDAPTGEPTSGEASPAPSARPSGRWPAPILNPSNKTRTVAGIRCRVVRELLDGEPVIEHCMANSARLKVTDRELITLARSFGMARNMEFGWLGVGTQDEEFVSVQSRDLRDERLLELTSVSTKPLAEGYLRIPKTYSLVEPDTKNK